MYVVPELCFVCFFSSYCVWMYLLGPDGGLATLASPGHHRLCKKRVNKKKLQKKKKKKIIINYKNYIWMHQLINKENG